MESEKKRVVKKEIKEKVVVKEEEEEKEDAVAQSPTEAEVDEFFAILKRIQVAIRYFEKTSAQNNSSHSSGHAQKLTASEEEVNGVKVGEKKVENSGLDLNTIPEPDANI
ncbi:Hypothetical predicted protein [Olea europaea subsp. europaea]|uniref:Uncharacterized protein n=1 Tax=Olea europaea subsp. europaea TaxID=158383 RepID=A0A8S0U3R5_OLEEU|nr:Hypothetical predicted protein [Olea europaea subsp. europaea]